MSEEKVIDVTHAPLATAHTAMSALNVASLIPMAKEYRRDMRRATEEAIELVTLDEETAKSCFYSLARGGKKISGPSIGLAETLAATWGNLVLSCDDIEEGDEYVIVRGWICDTQSGLASQDFIRRRITKTDGTRYDGDMINVTINAARSLLYRNLVLRLVPRPIVAKIYEAARNVATGDGKTFAERQKTVVTFWESQGVTKETLLRHLGHSKQEQINVEDIDYLLGINNAIKDGETTIAKIFSRPLVQDDGDTLAARVESKAKAAKENNDEL